MTNWEKHPPNKIINPHADYFLQKKVGEQSLNIYVYGDSAVIEAQIEVGEKTANLQLFSYKSDEIDIMEKGMLALIKEKTAQLLT